MLYVSNQGITNPKLNLAIEEYILKHLSIEDTYLLFYINEPSIIIGKHQNTVEEINADYVEEHGIHVVRRLSGGGAVYHDLGNLNFSFITKNDGSFSDFEKFTRPVVDVLQSMGVPANFKGRNDLEVEGRKISGNAQYATGGRMFSHGTLMFDSEIENVVSALNVNMEKIKSKGIQSIRKRVANISEFIEQEMTTEEFKQAILESIFGSKEKIEEYVLTDEDWEKIHQISEERYQKWEWNYGESPPFNVRHEHRFDQGKIDVRLDVEQNVIHHAKIYGDFFGVGDVIDIEQRLIGVRYEKSALRQALQDMDVPAYLGGVSKEDFLDLIY